MIKNILFIFLVGFFSSPLAICASGSVENSEIKNGVKPSTPKAKEFSDIGSESSLSTKERVLLKKIMRKAMIDLGFTSFGIFMQSYNSNPNKILVDGNDHRNMMIAASTSLPLAFATIVSSGMALKKDSKQLSRLTAILSILEGGLIVGRFGHFLYSFTQSFVNKSPNLKIHPEDLKDTKEFLKIAGLVYVPGALGGSLGSFQIYDGVQLAKEVWRKNVRESVSNDSIQK